MRLCILTADVGAIAARRDALLASLARVSAGRRFDEVYVVGFRQTGPVADGVVAVHPYVDPASYTSTRIANTVFRVAAAAPVPAAIVRAALRQSASAFVEAILACDPDAVLLDVTWASDFGPIVHREFPGPIYVAGDRGVSAATRPFLSPADPSTKVSIVLPTYNGSKYIRQSIQSCLDQSHRHLEVIVVDDGSKEDMRSVVAEFTDDRVRYIRHERNIGLPGALNTGFAAATGEFLTWTSDDNYYAPSAISRLTRFLQRYPQISFVYSSLFIVDEFKPGPPRVRRSLPPADLKHQNSLGACFLYTRQVYREIGDYDAGATLVEDYDYWVRVSRRFRMQRLIDPLYYYRYHDASLTAKHTPEDVSRRFDVVREQNRIQVAR